MEGNRHVHAHRQDHHHHEGSGFGRRLAHLIRPHGHEAADRIDPAMETSRDGMRTLWLSLL
ncbi:cation diffusion facilitator family transporter, partial [Streptomyces sp. NPDC054949]